MAAKGDGIRLVAVFSQEYGKDALFDSLFPDLKQFKARCA